MNDFLLVLFYQAIVAVNTAVIISGIIWLAKRKEEKDGRKPPTTGNFGITEDTVKELGRAMARIGVSCDTIAEALNGLADAMRKREEPSGTPKPQTTGTSANEPEPQSAEVYIREIRDGIGNKVLRTVTMRCGTCRWHDDNDMCHCEEVCNPEKLPFFASVKRHKNHPPCKYWEEAVKTDNRGNETPKPPTTGTSAVKPKKRKYDEYSVLPYAVGTVQRFYKPILTSAIVQAEDGKIIIPPEEAGTPVSGYGDGKIYGYVQTLAPDDGNDDGKAYPINPRTGEVEGYPAIDGTVYRVYFWTSGKAAKTVNVVPSVDAICCDSAEAQKEASFTVYNPAEESVKRYEHDCIDAKCEKCKYFHANYAGDFGYCVQNDEIKHPYEAHGCFEKREGKDHERQNL